MINLAEGIVSHKFINIINRRREGKIWYSHNTYITGAEDINQPDIGELRWDQLDIFPFGGSFSELSHYAKGKTISRYRELVEMEYFKERKENLGGSE